MARPTLNNDIVYTSDHDIGDIQDKKKRYGKDAISIEFTQEQWNVEFCPTEPKKRTKVSQSKITNHCLITFYKCMINNVIIIIHQSNSPWIEWQNSISLAGNTSMSVTFQLKLIRSRHTLFYPNCRSLFPVGPPSVLGTNQNQGDGGGGRGRGSDRDSTWWWWWWWRVSVCVCVCVWGWGDQELPTDMTPVAPWQRLLYWVTRFRVKFVQCSQ